MARTFNGTAQNLRTAAGGLGGTGAYSCAAIVRTGSSFASRCIFCADTSASQILEFQVRTGGVLSLYDGGGGTAPNSTTTLSTSKWYLVAVSKAAGTATPRFHGYDFTANAWFHEAGTTTAGDPNVTTGYFIGCTGPTATPVEFWNGDIAIVGAWRAQLTDAQIESLPFSLMAWMQLSPGGLWLLDQQGTGQKMPDISGSGGNEAASGTPSLSTNSVPIFSYGAPFLTSIGIKAVRSSLIVSGGGDIATAATKGAKSAAATSGGGAVMSVATKGAKSAAATSGGGAVMSVATKGAKSAAATSGGGAVMSVATKGAKSTTTVSGGGDVETTTVTFVFSVDLPTYVTLEDRRTSTTVQPRVTTVKLNGRRTVVSLNPHTTTVNLERRDTDAQTAARRTHVLPEIQETAVTPDG